MGPAPCSSTPFLAADEPCCLDQPLCMRRRMEVHHVARCTKARQQKPIRRDLRCLRRVLRDIASGSADVILLEANHLELPAPTDALTAGGYLDGLDCTPGDAL